MRASSNSYSGCRSERGRDLCTLSSSAAASGRFAPDVDDEQHENHDVLDQEENATMEGEEEGEKKEEEDDYDEEEEEEEDQEDER